MKRIVVGVDGSEHSLHALQWAAREAELHRARLVAVKAWSFLDPRATTAGVPLDPSYGSAEVSRELEALVNEALGAGAGDQMELHAVCDLPGRALVDTAAEADLLVVGTRGRGGFAGLLLGSVSRYCLHHAPGPVALIRAAPTSNIDGSRERIVVGVDGSSASDAALRWALGEARVRAAHVHAVHAWELPFLVPPAASSITYDIATFQDAARETLGAAIGRVAPAGDDDVTTELVSGGPAWALLETAKEADLIVLGTRGLSGARAALLGSVSSQVAHHATGTVVVVPEGAS